MACAITTQWGNHIYWIPPNRDDISHYIICRRTDEVAPIGTADMIAHVPFVLGTASSPHYFDPFTAINTSVAYTYWVKSIAWDGQSSALSLKITATSSPSAIQTSLGSMFADTFEPNGFPNRSDSVFSFSTTTMTFSISPAVTSFNYYVEGIRYTAIAALTQAIPATSGLSIFYLTSAGLTYTSSVTDDDFEVIIERKAIVSVVYYNTADSTQVYLGEERHGVQMDGKTHHYLHDVNGLMYESGFGINTITADATGGVDADAQFGIDAGEVYDEDINITASQALAANGLTIFYRSGTNGYWRTVTKAGFSVYITAVGTRITYNAITSGEWSLIEVTNNQFALCHVFATTKTTNQIIAIMGQNQYSTLANARTGGAVEINNLLLGSLPGPEMKPLYTIIFQTSNAYGNTVKARVRSTDTGTAYYDWRTSGLQRTTGGGDHGSLTGLTDDDHPQYLLLAGRTAVQTICGAITLNGVSSDLTIGNNNIKIGTACSTITMEGKGILLASSGDITITASSRVTLSSLNVTAAASIQTTLHVSGASTFGSTVVISGTLSINSNASITTSLTVGTYIALTSTTTVVVTAPASGIKLFGKDSAGLTKLMIVDSAGTELQVGTGGAGNAIYIEAENSAAIDTTGAAAYLVFDTASFTIAVNGQCATVTTIGGGAGNDTYIEAGGSAVLDTTAADMFVSFDSDDFDLTVASGNSATLTLADPLTVGTLNVTAALSVQTTLHVCGATTLGSSFTVSGASSFNGAVSVGSTLHVCSNTTISGTLSVTGVSNLGVVSVGSTLHVSGSATFGDTVTISGTTTVNGILNASTLNITANASVQGTLWVCGTTTLNGLTVSGSVSIQTLSITGNMSVQGTLWVSGSTTLNGLTNSGVLTTTTLNVTANASVQGTFHASGAVTFGSTVNISGAVSLSSTLWVCGTTTLVGAVDVSSILSVAGAVTFSSTLTVTGNVSVSGTFFARSTSDFYSNVSVGGTLHVCGAVTFSNQVTIGNNLIVSGTLTVCGTGTFYGVTIINNTLAVSGATSLSNTLWVCGTTTLVGVVNMSSTLSVAGVVTFSSTLTVTGATSISGTLFVGGATLLNSTLGVTGAVTFHTTLTVSGQTTISALDTKGNICANGTLLVSGATTLQGATVICGGLTANTIVVTSTLTVCAMTTLGGITKINNDTSISGNLTVENSIVKISSISTVIYGTLGVTVNALSVTGNATVVGTLKACGIVTFSDNLNVSGTLTTNGAVLINSTLAVTSSITQDINYVKSYIEFTAANSDPVAGTNAVRLYAKVSGVLTKLMVINSAGTTSEIPGAGGGGADTQLSNLTNVALGTSLWTGSGKTESVDIGGATCGIKTLYVKEIKSTTADITYCQNLFPTATSTYRLGTTAFKWQYLFVDSIFFSGAMSINYTAGTGAGAGLNLGPGTAFYVDVATTLRGSVAMGNKATAEVTRAVVSRVEYTGGGGGNGFFAECYPNPGAADANPYYGVGGYVKVETTNLTGELFGLSFGPYANAKIGGSTVSTTLVGVDTWGLRGWNGTLRADRAIALRLTPFINDTGCTANVSSEVALLIRQGSALGAGAVTNNYGILMDAPAYATNNYQIVLSGQGTGTGIWFSTVTGARVYSSTTKDFNISLNSTNILTITSVSMTIAGGQLSAQLTLSGSSTANCGIWFDSLAGCHIGAVSGHLYVSTLPSTPSTTNPIYWDNTTHKFHLNSSSKRYKENISDYDGNWNEILKVKPKTFTGIGGSQYQLGYIAEEIDELDLKHLVSYNNKNEPESLNYQLFSIYAIEVIKEQDKRIKRLEDEVTQMAKRFDKMVKEIMGERQSGMD